MKTGFVATCLLVCLGACQPASPPAAEAPPPPPPAAAPSPSAPIAPAAAASWEVSLDPVLTLTSGGDGLILTCEEAKKILRLSFEPAWEKEGPFDNAVVHFGDKAFPVKIDASAQKEKLDKYRPVYILPADADTVTAVMLATNVRLVMNNQDGEQERSGEPTDNGAFDTFGTTCAQINGLH